MVIKLGKFHQLHLRKLSKIVDYLNTTMTMHIYFLDQKSCSDVFIVVYQNKSFEMIIVNLSNFILNTG
jgi:hypothetical protein